MPETNDYSLTYWMIWDSILNLATAHYINGEYTQASAIAQLERYLCQFKKEIEGEVEGGRL